MTSQQTLFDEFERSDHSPASRQERSFEFLNRSAWPAAENARTWLEACFASYPEGAKKDLRARFRKRDHNHRSAFFELFLYQVLLRLGLAPEVDPELSTGGSHPDFSITGGNGLDYYVEANAAGFTGDLVEDVHEAEIFDALDSLAAEKPLRIGCYVVTQGKLSPSVRPGCIKTEVSKWIAGIDPALITPGTLSELPPKKIECDAWTLMLMPFLLPRPSNKLIHGETKFAWGNEGEPLRKNVRKKARQHGKLKRPLIIALNTPSDFPDIEDEQAALVGRERMNAVWRYRYGYRYTGVHGVLIFRGVRPWNAHKATSHVYLNPFIDADIPDELLRLGSARWQEDTLTYEAGELLGDLLGLPKDWPGERTPERCAGDGSA